MGFEPTTPTLARLCSTPELRPHSVEGLMTESEKARKRRRCHQDITLAAKCRNEKRHPKVPFFTGAGDGIRTHDPNLGKVVLYP